MIWFDCIKRDNTKIALEDMRAGGHDPVKENNSGRNESISGGNLKEGPGKDIEGLWP